MKLVFVTQTLDPEHAALAQTIDLVRALSARVDELVVVSRHLHWNDLPANVTVRTFDRSTRPARVLAFEQALLPSLRGADAVFVHMVPEFLLLSAPATRLRSLPLLLWYTHWHAGRALRLATRLCDVALSVDVASFPLRSPKVRGIGHAIDTTVFTAPPEVAHDGPVRLLAVGRTARWKGLSSLLDALALVTTDGLDATLEIRGPSLTADEREHRDELARRIESDESLRTRAQLLESVPRAEIPRLLGDADVIVSPNEPRSGAALDKAVFEAAACGRPVVSTNEAFEPLLGSVGLPLLAAPRNPASLAQILRTVGAATADERAAVGAELRARVVERHSLDHWADAVISAVTEVRSARGG